MQDELISKLTSTLLPSNTVNPPSTKANHKPVHAVADSGATSNYLRPNDTHCATSVEPDNNGPTVVLPNGATITSNSKAQLPLSPQLSSTAQQAHVLPGLMNTSLLSVGKFCDDDCDVLFRKKKLHVLKDKEAVNVLWENKNR